MDFPERPRLQDFEARIGTSFQARTPDGVWIGEWTLVHCEALPKPPLDQLSEADCFALAWSSADQSPQGLYLLETADGFKTLLFAVPGSADRMWVTVN